MFCWHIKKPKTMFWHGWLKSQSWCPVTKAVIVVDQFSLKRICPLCCVVGVSDQGFDLWPCPHWGHENVPAHLLSQAKPKPSSLQVFIHNQPAGISPICAPFRSICLHLWKEHQIWAMEGVAGDEKSPVLGSYTWCFKDKVKKSRCCKWYLQICIIGNQKYLLRLLCLFRLGLQGIFMRYK